jgi:hypothetical protein
VNLQVPSQKQQQQQQQQQQKHLSALNATKQSPNLAFLATDNSFA